MKLIIDDRVSLRHKLTLEEALVALAVKYTDLPKTIDNLTKRGVLVNNDDTLSLSETWTPEVDQIIFDSSGGNDDRLKNLAKEMRELYPAGKMPNTPFYYRCNQREIVLKLKKFFEAYGSYPAERILDATKRYVASFQGDYRYLPLIKYFILKNKTVTGEDGLGHVVMESPLASYLENKEDSDVNNASDDWLMTVRN